MKKVLFLLSFALFIGVAQAQTENEQVWHSDVNVAIQQSLATKKPMFLFFTGSDWCGWCIRLQKEVFQTPYFTQWSKENVILVELDYPRKKQLPEEAVKPVSMGSISILFFRRKLQRALGITKLAHMSTPTILKWSFRNIDLHRA